MRERICEKEQKFMRGNEAEFMKNIRKTSEKT
jgi:hypothetical protein